MTLRCAHCSTKISDARPTDPVEYCDEVFCDQKCAQRWSFHQLPKVKAALGQSRSYLYRILTKARGGARQLARAALAELRSAEKHA